MKALVGSFFPVPEWTEWGWKYGFTTNTPVPREKWPEINMAIEAVMNDVKLYRFDGTPNFESGEKSLKATEK